MPLKEKARTSLPGFFLCALFDGFKLPTQFLRVMR